MRGKTLICLVLIAGFSLNSWSAAIFVNSTSDDSDDNGNCTLREAIESANYNHQVDQCVAGSSSGTDTIAILTNGTIQMQPVGYVIVEDLTIAGPGADSFTIDGNGRAFSVDMAVSAHDFTLQDLTISGCSAGSSNGGAVVLVNVDVARFTNVHFISNLAAEGGAIGVSDSIADDQNRIVVDRCVFRDNQATDFGGALAAGALSSGANRTLDLEIKNTLFTFNNGSSSGGAIALQVNDQYSTPLILDGSTFVGNTAQLGGAMTLVDTGGVQNNPHLIQNCTFVANTATSSGGALNINNAEFRMVHSTLVRNQAPSGAHISKIPITSGPVTEIGRNVFDGAVGGDSCSAPSISSIGYNINSDSSCNLVATGDITDTSAALGGLGEWGGHTPTLLPGIYSPAVDGGDFGLCEDAAGNNLTVDQRDYVRVQNGSGIGSAYCDPGSVEVENDWNGLFFDGFEEGSTSAW